jgi:hypothetical protein
VKEKTPRGPSGERADVVETDVASRRGPRDAKRRVGRAKRMVTQPGSCYWAMQGIGRRTNNSPLVESSAILRSLDGMPTRLHRHAMCRHDTLKPADAGCGEKR